MIGNYLNPSEIKELVIQIKESEKYKNLIQEMSHYTVVDDSKFEVSQAIKFDLIQNKEVISAKSLTLQLPNNIFILYVVRHKNGNKNQENDFLMGTIEEKNENGGSKDTKFYAQNNSSISIAEYYFSKEQNVEAAYLEEKSKKEFPIDEKYYPGQLLEQVNSQAWYSGCMIGGYRWCGESCGGSAACNSSLAGINGLDDCCKSHDCCYSQRGVSHPNCYCDERLCNCAKAAKLQVINTPLVLAAMCFSC